MFIDHILGSIFLFKISSYYVLLLSLNYSPSSLFVVVVVVVVVVARKSSWKTPTYTHRVGSGEGPLEVKQALPLLRCRDRVEGGIVGFVGFIGHGC